MILSMTKKERVISAIEHKTPDRIPKSDSFWEDTLALWYKQGYPESIPTFEYFDFDIVNLSIDASPRFKPQLLKEEIDRGEKYITFQDRMGYVVKKIYKKSRTLDYISYPAPDWESWEKIKPMFKMKPGEKARIDDVGFPFRLDDGSTWSEVKAKYQKFREDDYYILAGAYGPHEATWRFHGFTETLIDLLSNPDLIKDISETYMNFLIEVIERCLHEGIKIDGFIIIDDIAATNGLLFSPDTWRNIYKPVVSKLGKYLQQTGIHFWMHCCGNAEVMFNDFIECGLQVINPLEAKSGLNVRQLKNKYGNQLTFYGNINVIQMSHADKQKIRQEIESKLSTFKNGGYIYHSDHSIPPEVSFERYLYVMELVNI